MGGFITKNCPLAIYFQFRFYKSCTCHVFYVWRTMTWIDKWPYFSISFTREPQFLKEKWSPPSSHPGDRKRLFFILLLCFISEREGCKSEGRGCCCSSLPWRWPSPLDPTPALVLQPFPHSHLTMLELWEGRAALGHSSCAWPYFGFPNLEIRVSSL